MEISLQHRIRERAYEIWNPEGRIHGQAEQHWLAAEREILAQMSAETPASPPLTVAKVVRRRLLTNVQAQPKKAVKASSRLLRPGTGEAPVSFKQRGFAGRRPG
jgi:hypothetical protein